MVFHKVHLENNDDVLLMYVLQLYRLKLLNHPVLHALIVCMFQFDTKLFTLQLPPLKTDVSF
jgi:hypothetical protein